MIYPLWNKIININTHKLYQYHYYGIKTNITSETLKLKCILIDFC